MRIATFFAGVVLVMTLVSGDLTNLSPGIYKERLGAVSLTGRKAEVWIKLDLQEIRNDFIQLRKINDTINASCKLKNLDCSNFYNSANYQFNNLHSKLDKITGVGKSRSRRGLIDGIGSSARFLFGSMDAEDRSSINKKLENLQTSNLNNIKFNYKYAGLIQQTITNLNTTISVCNQNNRLMNSISERTNELARMIEDEFYMSQLTYFIFELQLTYQTIYFESMTKIDAVMETLMDFHNGNINTKLVGYKIVVDELREMKIGDKFKLPIDVKNPDFELLRVLMKFGVLINDGKLFIIFFVPLLWKDQRSLMKLYGIPEIEGEIAKFIEIRDDFIILDDDAEKLAFISKQSFDDKCKEFRKSFYCEKVFQFHKEHNLCELSIFHENDSEIKRLCGIRVTKVKNIQFIRTMDDNKYIVIAPSKVFGRLYFNNTFKGIEFEKTQFLSIEHEAELRLKQLEINFIAKNLKIETSFSLLTNFSFDAKFSPNTLNIPIIDKAKIIDNSELLILSQKIENLMEENNKEETSQKTFFQYLIAAISIITLLSLAISFAFYTFNKRLKKMKKQNNPENIEMKILKSRLSKSESDLVNNLK